VAQPESTSQRTSRYGVHPAFAMQESTLANLKAKTGQSLDEWIKLLEESGPAPEKSRADWLKARHHLGTNVSAWIAERAAGRDPVAEYDPDALVAAMYAGPKAALRPVYERLLTLGLELGNDVRACPATTIVPLYRHHVFAELKPTTRTRIDLGLALKDTPATGRLIGTGGLGKGDRVTHRIPVSSLDEIDEAVTRWLETAYDLDA